MERKGKFAEMTYVRGEYRFGFVVDACTNPPERPRVTETCPTLPSSSAVCQGISDLETDTIRATQIMEYIKDLEISHS